MLLEILEQTTESRSMLGKLLKLKDILYLLNSGLRLCFTGGLLYILD